MDPGPFTVMVADCEVDRPPVELHTNWMPEPPETGDDHANESWPPGARYRVNGSAEYEYVLEPTVSTVPEAPEERPLCEKVMPA